MNDFVLKLRELRDRLESVGYVPTEEDNLLYLIESLDRDFESIVYTISTKMQNKVITIFNAIAMLLGH